MKFVHIEATNIENGGFNWGKFLVGKPEAADWQILSQVDHAPLLSSRGWGESHHWVLDLQTGEGAYFHLSPTGHVKADLNKRRIWVCPLFEPFLAWLYKQDLTDLDRLPKLVDLDAPSDSAGYRRPGREEG